MNQPLSGWRVVNTRAPHQATRLDELLRQAGAEPLPYPCIQIAPPASPAPLDGALGALAAGGFDWLAVTSRNTVESLRHRLEARGLMLPSDLRIAAVGPGTEAALAEAFGRAATHLPPQALGEALARTLPASHGRRVLLPQSALAQPDVADTLRARGFDVTAVEAYRTMRGTGGVRLRPLLEAGSVAAICLTSGSTATYLVERLAEEGLTPNALNRCVVACIGPRTAEAARRAGLPVTHVAELHTLEGLVAVLAQARGSMKATQTNGQTSEVGSKQCKRLTRRDAR